jgi:hypothetical protein
MFTSTLRTDRRLDFVARVAIACVVATACAGCSSSGAAGSTTASTTPPPVIVSAATTACRAALPGSVAVPVSPYSVDLRICRTRNRYLVTNLSTNLVFDVTHVGPIYSANSVQPPSAISLAAQQAVPTNCLASVCEVAPGFAVEYGATPQAPQFRFDPEQTVSAASAIALVDEWGRRIHGSAMEFAGAAANCGAYLTRMEDPRNSEIAFAHLDQRTLGRDLATALERGTLPPECGVVRGMLAARGLAPVTFARQLASDPPPGALGPWLADVAAGPQTLRAEG